MKQLILSILVICPALLQAQTNLVRNGSFEHYSSCPLGIDQIRKANYWNTIDTVHASPTSLPEYCNACADLASGISVPFGSAYHHYPRTGNGMVQSNMYFDDSYSGEPAPRNYTQGKLYTHLTPGRAYYATFYVTLCQESKYAIDHIGAYLDNGSIDSGQNDLDCALPQTRFTPQIIADSIINDTTNWVKIQGRFIANGAEKFITVGNFSDDAHTDTVTLYSYSGSNFSFYLIDDVSVIADTARAHGGGNRIAGVGDTVHIGTDEEGMPCIWYKLGDTTNPIGYGGGMNIVPTVTGEYQYVVKLDLQGNVSWDTIKVTVWPQSVSSWQLAVSSLRVYPNPATSEVTIDCFIPRNDGYEVVFYDMVGSKVLQSMVNASKKTINIASLPQGVYSVHIADTATGEKLVRTVVKE